MNTEEKKREPEPYFVVEPGRYYDRMDFIALDKSIIKPFGGDFNSLIWRYADTPDEWYLTYRIRYYSGPNSDAFLGDDRKSWYVVKPGSLEKARESIRLVLLVTAGIFNPRGILEIDQIKIEGDSDKFFKAVKEAKKSWLHMKQMEPNQ